MCGPTLAVPLEEAVVIFSVLVSIGWKPVQNSTDSFTSLHSGANEADIVGWLWMASDEFEHAVLPSSQWS